MFVSCSALERKKTLGIFALNERQRVKLNAERAPYLHRNVQARYFNRNHDLRESIQSQDLRECCPNMARRHFYFSFQSPSKQTVYFHFHVDLFR